MIRNVEQAFKEIKNFSVEGWDGDYRPAGRQFLKEVLEEQMALAVDRYLAEVVVQGIADGRNGSYPRHLLTELGDLELSVRRTRTFNPASLLKQWAGRFARRARSVERMILSSFTLGLSTRKVGPALLPVLGELVSAATVSRIARRPRCHRLPGGSWQPQAPASPFGAPLISCAAVGSGSRRRRGR